jgi:hypothetical protein
VGTALHGPQHGETSGLKTASFFFVDVDPQVLDHL